jgi:hypothetical protein
MAAYELVIEARQPTCGGRAPTKCEVLNVFTEDPMAYVQGREPGAKPELVQDENGVVVITVKRNGLPVKYEFTAE